MYDYQFTNSEGCVFNKLVFLNWCVHSSAWPLRLPLPLVDLLELGSETQCNFPHTFFDRHTTNVPVICVLNLVRYQFWCILRQTA